MAEFKDVFAIGSVAMGIKNDLDHQIEDMISSLSSMGISVTTSDIKATVLMSKFSYDKFNHSIQPTNFVIGEYSDGNSIYGVSSLPLDASLIDSGLKFRNPSNPSAVLSGTCSDMCISTSHTFKFKDMNPSEGSFIIDYPTLCGKSGEIIYPKEVLFIGKDNQFMIYQNTNYELGLKVSDTDTINFVIRMNRYHWDNTKYAAGWFSKKRYNYSYYDATNKKLHLVFANENLCQELLDSEWQVYTMYTTTAPTGDNEPTQIPTYRWSLASSSTAVTTARAYDVQLVDNRPFFKGDSNMYGTTVASNDTWDTISIID